MRIARTLRAAAKAAALLFFAAFAVPASAQAADLRDHLAAGPWTLAAWSGKPAPYPIGISFTRDGKISGHGACNQYTGLYSLDGERVTFTVIGWTKMWCGARTMLDQRFAADLKRSVRLVLTTDGLATYGSAGGAIFQFRHAPPHR